MKCPACEQLMYGPDVSENLDVCPACGHHMRIGARARISHLCDPDAFEERYASIEASDPLGFTVEQVNYSYEAAIERARSRSGMREAAVMGRAVIDGEPCMLGVMDFSFRGGSMGGALGEKFSRIAADALDENLPFVMICTSGGARMEEGMLALMQMAKTSDSVRRLKEAGVLYITVLTHPTMGGVYASFASQGDIILAEPKATVGFAGPRLIEGALKVKLPEGFQTAEYQLEHGFVDQIVTRLEMRRTLGRLLRYLGPSAERVPA